jgi:hypothetical protein
MTTVRLNKRSKYGNKRARDFENEEYASQKEANRGSELKILQLAGEISGLSRQRRWQLLPPMEGYLRPLEYVSDFDYFHKDGTAHVEDVKGYRTDVYRIKKRLMWQLLGIKVEEV